MDQLKTVENQVARVRETVSSVYVPPLQLTKGQPPPIAANGGPSSSPPPVIPAAQRSKLSPTRNASTWSYFFRKDAFPTCSGG